MRHSSFILTPVLWCLAALLLTHSRPGIAETSSGFLVQQRILNAQNIVRKQHDLPPLVWSDQLAKFAQQWADQLASQSTFFHRPNNEFGENMFLIQGRQAEPDEVVQRWVSESADYDERSGFCKTVCGHYTQVVWGGTKSVGCAVSTALERQIWVCDYDPAGNIRLMRGSGN